MPLRVLVVDDHVAFRRLAGRLLESGGLLVVGEAGTGASALALAGELRPDVVLLDVQLPDVDGFSVCRGLRAIGVAVVLCSVRDHAAQAAACGAVGFVRKERLSAEVLLRSLGEPQPGAPRFGEPP